MNFSNSQTWYIQLALTQVIQYVVERETNQKSNGLGNEIWYFFTVVFCIFQIFYTN